MQVLLKYIAACDCSEKRSATAESPIKTIDKGPASTSLVAAIAVMKFADHTPLARQATQVFKRSGIELAQSSMCRWMAKAAELLEPLYDLMCELILLSYCLSIVPMGDLPSTTTKRMLRLAAIGRRNWLFFGSANEGKTGM